ncbi:hypothetical protein PR048_012909 [Dryococelus australis]|uniref:Uncharacterized protein n=1 Tax=Dryococelus australis TaxID=614101 RepID=A0ABQ9HQN2_9NEOP|nr:hypothetical protein PR048_012909 [Dryococelus australis]
MIQVESNKEDTSSIVVFRDAILISMAGVTTQEDCAVRDISTPHSTQRVNTSLYYSCPNLVERVNKNLKLHFAFFTSCLNSVIHSTTSLTLCKVFLGREFSFHLLNVWAISSENQTCVNLTKPRKAVATQYNVGRQNIFYSVEYLVVCRQMIQSKKVDHFSAKLAMPF